MGEGGWHLVQKLLEQTGEHSTLIGKFWVTSFFIIRLLIVSAISEQVWKDSQKEFVCNTLSPGCKNVCFNEFSPIALTRYWYLQLLFTALPSLIFMVYTAHKMAIVGKVLDARKAKIKKLKKEERKQTGEEEEEDSSDDQESKQAGKEDENSADEKKKKIYKNKGIVAAKLSDDAPSKLFIAYFFMVLIRLMVEVGFIVGQFHVYTFKFLMPELWQCQHWPCPNVVDCFVARPKEKSVLICVFYVTGCIMIILNVMELCHLAPKLPKAWKERRDDITAQRREGPQFGQTTYREWAPGTGYIEAESYGYPNVAAIPALHPRPRDRRNQRALGWRR